MNDNTIKRINKVIQIEATTTSIGDFLVSHVPFENLFDNEFKSTISEEQLLYDVILKNPEEHKFIMIQGDNGSGKSHLIRWMKEKYIKNVDENKEAVLIISRAHNTLQDAMAQLLESDIFPKVVKENELKTIKNTRSKITGEELKKTINFYFTLEIDSDKKREDEIINLRTRKWLSTYLKDDYIQKEFLLPKNGPIERIRAKIENVNNDVNIGDDPMFKESDFAISYSQMSRNLNVADGRAADYTIRLAEKFADPKNGTDLRIRVAKYLNFKVSNVIQKSMNLQTSDLKKLFASLRKTLKNQGINLTLFIEDINAFTGIDEALMEVLLTNHNSVGNEDYCRIISVVGSTCYFYNSKLNASIKERISNNIYIREESVLGEKEKLSRFAAKYINAINLTEEEVNKWVQAGAIEADLPVYKCQYKWADINCNGKSMSIFPFNDTALWKLYQTLPQDKRTPRIILKSIIAHLLKIWFTSPKNFLSSENNFINSDITMPYWIRPIYKQTNSSIDSESELERGILLKIWGDGTANIENGRCGGLEEEIFRVFNVYSGIKDDVIIGTINKFPEYREKKEIEKIIKNKPTEKIGNEISEKLKSIEEDLERWLNKKQVLVNHIEFRELLRAFFISSIDWNVDEVPMVLVDKFIIRRRIHIEGQGVSIGGGIILNRNEETYNLLLALANWKHLGDGTWCFEASSDYLVTVTVWLNKYKDMIIDSVNAPKDKTDIWNLPLWNIAALYCIKTLFGGVDITKTSEEIVVELMSFRSILLDKTIHSESWQKLKKYIFENSSFNEDIYKDTLAYFSKSVGSAKAGETNYIFVDGYELVKLVSKLKSANWNLDGMCPIITEDNKEIWYNAAKVINKFSGIIIDIIKEENKKADNYLSMFEQIFDNNFSEESIGFSINYIKNFLLFLTNSLNMNYNESDYQILKSSTSVKGLVKGLLKLKELKKCEIIPEILMKISENPFDDIDKYYTCIIAFNILLNDKEKVFDSIVDIESKKTIENYKTNINNEIDEILIKVKIIDNSWY